MFITTLNTRVLHGSDNMLMIKGLGDVTHDYYRYYIKSSNPTMKCIPLTSCVCILSLMYCYFIYITLYYTLCVLYIVFR